MMEELKRLANELDEILVREHPEGLWLVLEAEYPQQQITAGDLLGVEEPYCRRAVGTHRRRAQTARSTGSGFTLPVARFTKPPW
jgi:hypothetical protein